ncbi:MAG TPA: Hpt domain-containing protein [Gallionella sp.]|nr:Hpt domain-containing protein [Gallionella sp.]
MTFEPTSGGDLVHLAGLPEGAGEEVLHYARALRQHFTVFKALHEVPPQFIYAAHALAEASRPLKVQPVVELAAALEDWLRARRDRVFEPDAAQLESLEQVVAALDGMAQSVSERCMPQAQPDLVQRLQSEGRPQAPAVPGREGGWESLLESQVRDDVDVQLLPVFLEEADGLGGKIRAVLRAWRESPDDERHGQSLKRLLHTLKGSARMAGAMRIGEIVHAMEDRAEDDARERMQPSFWEALSGDLERIAALLEELRAIGPAVSDRKEDAHAPEPDTPLTRAGQRAVNEHMAPFASIGGRLYRTVRQMAKELNKRVNLELPGAGVEVDRRMLERMTAPIEHLLRNAIVHGLESEPVRIRLGKSPIGEIRLDLRQESGQVVLELSDDGAGLNFAALRAKALEQGLLQPNEAASDERLAQLIFVPGFSTATEVSEVAGRGVGLDVVRAEVDALGGRIDVGSQSGQGTRFTIYLPLEPAVR